MTTPLSRLKRALLKASVALAIGALFILLPLPLGPWKRYQLLKDGVVGFVLVTYLGKVLFDTLFYDRYWPYVGHKGGKRD
ncbi:MAG: hypothetical protein HY671_13640 [Chloroflexi bacterium]|nr:hypothetical protein [Chloroflexota bacterium]